LIIFFIDGVAFKIEVLSLLCLCKLFLDRTVE